MEVLRAMRNGPAVARTGFALLLGLVLLAVGSGLGPSPERAPQPGTAQPAPGGAQRAPTAGDRPAAAPREPTLPLHEFRPQSMLHVPSSAPNRAQFPVVDMHTHFRVRLHGSNEALDQFVQVMDRQGIAICISLDAALGDNVQEHRDELWRRYPDRFLFFVHPDWKGSGAADDPSTWDCHRPDFSRRVVRLLSEARAAGASGLKLFKQFGLGYRNPDGGLVRIDDPRWDPIWEACGELQLPVLMHVADPAAFFLPIDARNERFEELSRRPEWSFYGDDFPAQQELLRAWLQVVARHPRTIFIGAHLGNHGEDLGQLADWLDQHPNLFVEIASRISELGRQPYTARRFLVEYADRLLFGTDGPWPEERIMLYWRFLETLDEYFPYSEKPFPPQGFWNIYGVGLPDDVLRKIYWQNAARLIPGVAERLRRQGVVPDAAGPANELPAPLRPAPGRN
jgi:predicted TIM-barrel fold metal-dependent hydrolase